MLRGIQLNSVTIFDEVQNALLSSIETVMTRMQEHSLLILCGDSSGSQNDLGKKSGFSKACEMFNNQESKEHGIFYVKLGVEDIVRSKFVQFVAEKFSKI
jgi:phosphate starvation-inducible protein PhoH